MVLSKIYTANNPEVIIAEYPITRKTLTVIFEIVGSHARTNEKAATIKNRREIKDIKKYFLGFASNPFPECFSFILTIVTQIP